MVLFITLELSFAKERKDKPVHVVISKVIFKLYSNFFISLSMSLLVIVGTFPRIL